MSFLLKSSKPHSCGYGFYTGWPEIIQRNCNIISEFYWIHVQFNRKKGNLHTQQRVETNTHIESFISNTVYEWRLPDVLYILLLVCVFFYIHSFIPLAIYCPHHPEQCTHLRKMEGSTAKHRAQWYQKITPLWIESVYVTLFIILILTLHVDDIYFILKCNAYKWHGKNELLRFQTCTLIEYHKNIS